MNGRSTIQFLLTLGIESLVWVTLVELYRTFVGPETSSFREVLGVLIVARLAFWAADVIRRYLIWRVLLREQRVNQIINLLKDAKFPIVTSPDTFANYMCTMEDNERASLDQRMLARDFRVVEEVIAEIDWIAGAQIFWERIYVMDRLLKQSSQPSP